MRVKAGLLRTRIVASFFSGERAIDDDSDPRGGRRSPVNAEVQLRRSGALNFMVEIHDLSEHGCRTEFVERPRIGETVWVKLGALAPLESTVRWVNGFQGGLEFRRPMDSRVLRDLLASLRRAPRA